MRTNVVNRQFVSPGQTMHLSISQGRPMPNQYNPPPFPNASPMRPPWGMFGASECTNSTSADTYRQHHEVNAMVLITLHILLLLNMVSYSFSMECVGSSLNKIFNDYALPAKIMHSNAILSSVY